MSQNKFPWTLSVCALIAVSILLGLGVWQIQRLTWKTQLISDIEQAYSQPALFMRGADIKKAADLDMKRAQIKGTLMPQHAILLQSKTHESEIGYHLVMPLRTMDEQAIFMVNLGWVPESYTIENSNISLNPQTFKGTFRKAKKSNSFIPDNNKKENIWYWTDPNAIGEKAGLYLLNTYVFRAETGLSELDYPIPQGSRPELRNDHLQYALFWFTLATVLIIIYSILLSRKMK